MKKFIIIIILAFIVLIIGYSIQQYSGNESYNEFVIKSKSITIRGKIDCLPGANALGCAIGLKGENGNYYALKNLNQQDLIEGKYPTGQRVKVSGIFTVEGNKTSKYDIAGTIIISKIRRIK